MLILTQDIKEYINANLNTDLHSLLLKKSPFSEISMQGIVQQIKGRKIAEKKFSFLNQENIFFPPGLNLEQASSQETALYKSKFFQGKKMVDLTCGFGIDAYFISQNFEEITLVEQNKELLEVVEHNWTQLGRSAAFVNQQLEEFIAQSDGYFDLIYLDPARRDQHNRKVFLLQDLSPNIVDIQQEMSQLGREILVKLSPLIDLQHLIVSLQNVAKIWILAVKNEVKEVLVLIRNKDQDTEISCVNLQTSEPDFNSLFHQEKSSKANYGGPLRFLFIPNNAVLKSGMFNTVAEKFGLIKLHQNTHLYTSDVFIDNFPGRVFDVQKITSRDIKKGEKFNIISKNYPLRPEEIKKKYKLNDGGDAYLVFCTSVKGKHILDARLISKS